METSGMLQYLSTQAVAVGLKVLGAIVIWIVGTWLIRFGTNLLKQTLSARQLDVTLVTYIASGIAVLLKVILIVAIFGYFGVETTSIAALLAGIGLAVGTMWGGLLGNLAAGAFLVFLRPFKVGDFISAGDIMGTVREIGLLVTAIDTMDNIHTFVGNSKILSGNIQNFSTNPYRRVDLKAQLNHGVNPSDAMRLLKEHLAKIPHVLSDPAPDVEILEFNLAGPVLAVRPYCNNYDYWQVYFDTNRVIRETFGAANFPVPEQHVAMRNI
ncbi:MAG TPA: mechanosensitive ion channel family protein [Dissulfurispiraceae bacterium]|nr:mechanosensitive ion channel family protein [Dissulfurispiraceae bacterium]